MLADVIRDLERDTAVIALGGDADTLALICDQVVTLSDGILVGNRPASLPPSGPRHPAAARVVGGTMTCGALVTGSDAGPALASLP